MNIVKSCGNSLHVILGKTEFEVGQSVKVLPLEEYVTLMKNSVGSEELKQLIIDAVEEGVQKARGY